MAREPGLWIGSHRPANRLIESAGRALASVALSAGAVQIDLPGPAGRVAFGTTVTVLANGNIVVTDPSASVPMPNAGAVSPANSLIGTTAGDSVGNIGVAALVDGNYVVTSSAWDNGGIVNAGAVTLARGDSGLVGTVSANNSVLETVGAVNALQGPLRPAIPGPFVMPFRYDTALERLAVGRPRSNIVSLFTLPVDLVLSDGFE